MIYIIPFFSAVKQFVTFVLETTIQNFLKTNTFLLKKLCYFFVYIFSFGIQKNFAYMYVFLLWENVSYKCMFISSPLQAKFDNYLSIILH